MHRKLNISHFNVLQMVQQGLVLCIFAALVFPVAAAPKAVPDGFVTQVLEPTGGKIRRPNGWFYVEEHRGTTMSWVISRENSAGNRPYTTGVRIQLFSGIQNGAGKSAKQFILDFVDTKKKEATQVIKVCDETKVGLFTRVCLETEEGPHHIQYSLFWGNGGMDMAVVTVAGTTKSLWQTYAPTFDVMSSIELFDMTRFEASLPPFLAPQYSDVLKIDGQPLNLVSQIEKDGVKLVQYVHKTGEIYVNVEQMDCDRPSCDALYEQTISAQNKKVTPLSGQFKSVSPSEFTVEWKEGKQRYLRHVAKVPKAIISWTRITQSKQFPKDEGFLTNLRNALNKQRFNEAVEMGNIEIGRWAPEIHQHALDLLAQGKKEEALSILKHVVTWSPNSLDAQLDFAQNTLDAKAARENALAVWENAESPVLTGRASLLLGNKETEFASVPLLEAEVTGLQVILVPLPPCDIRLIEAAGRLYSESLKVPVRVARLTDVWKWGQPDRIFQERTFQGLIQQKSGKPIDFTGWTRATYVEKLLALTAKDDALTRYQIRSFLDGTADKQGQYRAEPYVDSLIDQVTPLRSRDRRTMIVGVTEADIFGGETNFLFSGANSKNGHWAAILSYSRMQAAMLNEPYQSRKRVAERLAKELVPASLKQLGIPRPTDPSDPYSYSSGTERLAQKSLTLSAPTREALDRFRTP